MTWNSWLERLTATSAENMPDPPLKRDEGPQPPPPPTYSAKDILIATLREQVAWLRRELVTQREAAELREAEIRAQLVALANSNALASSAYYGPPRPGTVDSFPGRGVKRLVVPGRPAPASDNDDAPRATSPWDNALFGDEHLDLGPDFRVEVPATGPSGNEDEEALAEATWEAAAKEREAARLASHAPARGPLDDDEGG